MINKNYIHLLNYFASKNLLTGESKTVFRNPANVELVSSRERDKDALKVAQEKYKKRMEELKDYEKGFDLFIKTKTTIEIKGRTSIPAVLNELLGKNLGSLPKKVRNSKVFSKFLTSLFADMGHIFEQNAKIIQENMPCKVTLDKGGKLKLHNDKNFNLDFDIRKSSNSLKLLENLRNDIKALKERLGKKREVIVGRTVKEKTKLKDNVKTMIKENPTQGFDNLVKSDYVMKEGKGYVVKFLTPKGKIDRKAQKEVQIQDLFNLDKLKGGNILIRFKLSGVTPSGKKFEYWARYHSTAERFFIEGMKKPTRPKIYHDTKITNITYQAGPYVAPEDQKLKKSKTKEKLNKVSEIKDKAKEAQEEREKVRRYQDGLINDIHYHSIFQNIRVEVPKILRDDKHFKNVEIWKRASRLIDPILSEPPFLITSPTQRRKYLQDVIQDYLNSRLYAEDFFKIPLEGGRMLYKGGYKQFIKDYYRVEKIMMREDIDEDNPKNPNEKATVKEWQKLRSLAFGLARIFDVIKYKLTEPDFFKKEKEKPVDVYRPMFLGVEKIEKEPKGTKYHSLQSLLHKQENAPASIDVGANDLMLAKINEKFNQYDLPGFPISDYLRSMGGMKLLFMSFGLDKLLAEKCLRKVDDKHYVLVDLPKYGWLEAMATIQQTGARLWVKPEHAKSDFAKWEKVRASLSQGMKARLFIRSIFTPTGSVVKENFNWWQGLWHGRAIWKKNKRIDMAHLGQITINPKHFEKYMAQDRGYLDMIEKTADRVPGTSIYQPNPERVLKKTNDYIEYGLTSVLMNMTVKDFHIKVPKLVKELGIENKIGMDTNALLNLDKDQILDVLYKALRLSNIEPDQLKGKKALLKLIRVGFILGRRIETSKKWAEIMNNNLPTDPLERKMVLDALNKGCPVYMLKAVRQKIHLAVVGLASGQIPGDVKTERFGAGAVLSFEAFNVNGNSMYISLGVFGQQGKTLQERCIPFLGISGAIKAGDKLSIKYAVGATTGFAGAAVGLEFPITKEWDMYLAFSAGADYKRKTVGIGGGFGAKWNRERALQLAQEKDKGIRDIKEIDKEIAGGKVDAAAKLILNHHYFGKYMKRLQKKLELTNEVIVDIYLQAKGEWANMVRRNQKIPWVLGFGAGAFVGVDAKSGKFASIGVGGYITFKVAGTEVNYVIRCAHPRYSEYMQQKATALSLRKQLKEQGLRNFKIASFVIKASSGILYFDSQMGRTGVARRVKERTANIADGKFNSKANQENPNRGKKKRGKVENFNTTFELAKKTFERLNFHVDKVKDPKNPKGFLLALTPLQTLDSNVEVLIDPAMKARGLILDRVNNRFLIAADVANDLYVTRSTYRYPFQRRGAMNLHVIAFKSEPELDNNTIRQRSPWSLYKFKGEKYQRIQNEAIGRQHYEAKIINGRPVLVKKPSNVMTMAEYKNSSRSFETFTDYQAEFSPKEGVELSDQLFTAIKYKEVEPVRSSQLQLKKFSDQLYADKKFQRPFDIGVGKLQTPKGENEFKTKWFKKIAERYKTYAKKEGISATLNEQEKNLIYAVLLDKSFTKLLDRNKKYPNVITRRLEIRNKLFINYMRAFIKNFKKNNPDQWKEITSKYKGATIDGIVNYLLFCMPQNFEQLKTKFLASKNNLPLKAGIKYGSYTHRFGKLQSMPTAFGVDSPEFKETLKMIKPTKLNINSPDDNVRAAANLILRMMSPLPTKNLEKLETKREFLKSELSSLLLSMYDEQGISPLLPILGKDKFKGLLNIMKNLDSPNLSDILKNQHSKAAFEDFQKIVLGIRKAQLNGRSTFTFGKYIFHVAKTDIYAGPYLKCGNGTVAVHQKIGIELKGAKSARLYGASTDVNIRTSAREKKAYGQFTVGIYTAHKLKSHKEPLPPRRETPHKTPTQPRTPNQGEMTGGGSQANPAPSTAVNPSNTTEGTGNL